MRTCLTLTTSLLLLACSTADTPPPVEVLHSAADFGTVHDYQLVAPDQAINGELPYPAGYPLLAKSLREGFADRGYQETREGALQVYYWLAIRETPLDYHVDMPPPNPLGPYQAIHRFSDETGTLRLRITDAGGKVLWEGITRTGLSPAHQRNELLKHAVDALLEELPPAR